MHHDFNHVHRYSRRARATQRSRRAHALHTHHLRQARSRCQRLSPTQLPTARVVSPRTPQVRLSPRDQRHGRTPSRISSILRYSRT